MNRHSHISKAVQAEQRSFLKSFGVLVKFKLSTIVVSTAILSYVLVAAGAYFSWLTLALLITGGYLVTFASNALNQVLEREHDGLMERTKARPVVVGDISLSNAVLMAGIMSVLGILALSMINPIVALLGTVSFMIYTFVYTPLKRHTTLSVAIGAIPGALPILIGTTAGEGSITLFGICLFAIQFFWQFPHFWAIGFLSFDDYSKAGFKLLPADEEGKIARSLGMSSTVYAALIIPVCVLLFSLNTINLIEFVGLSIISIGYLVLSLLFHKNFDRDSARKLMFYSFLYMPVVLIILLSF